MLFNHLKIALRNIKRQKFYAFINITGLTIGLVTSLLIVLYIIDEFSYDKFHKDADRIYRVNLMGRMSGQQFNSAYTSSPVASGFLNEIPGVQQACRIALWKDIPIEHDEDLFTEKKVLLADTNFFNFFSFRLLSGDPKEILARPNSIVLTETVAKKIFGYAGPGDNRCIGQNLEFGKDKMLCTITGICKDPPSNSHFHFSLILSMESWNGSHSPVWVNNNLLTYIKLQDDAIRENIESQIPGLVKKHIGPQAQQYLGISFEEFLEKGGAYGYYLQPLTDIHFEQDTDLHLEQGGNMKTIYLLIGIVIFIVVIACINFMNLSTARYSGRAKEVGIRKSMGSTSGRLRTQFLTESVLYTLISLLLAQFILLIILPHFNMLAGKLFKYKGIK